MQKYLEKIKGFWQMIKKDFRPIDAKVKYYFPGKWGRTQAILSAFFSLSLFFVILYKRVNPPLTPLMIIRSVNNAVHLNNPIRHSKWTPIAQINKSMIYATLAGEDQKFLDHFGVDFDALIGAVEHNLSSNGSVIGGSTISQQVAKNVFLWPGQSYIRKIFELYFTLIMEAIWDKERILEVYLNVAEFGDGLYGVNAAADYYFDTTPAKLTNYQSALLVSILPNPRYYQDHLKGYQLSKRKSAVSGGIGKMRSDQEIRDFVIDILK